MKAQFIGFQDMMKTALEKLGDFETWRLSADESFGTLMMQSEATTTRIQRLEPAPPPPPPPPPPLPSATILPRAPPPPPRSWVNPLDLNQAPQPFASMSECGSETADSSPHQEVGGGTLGHPPRHNMGMTSADNPLPTPALDASARDLVQHSPLFPKIEFPKFDGDNPRLWKDRCVMYFEVYAVHPSLKTHFVALNFTRAAAIWLQTV
jgi:hypothetical protein